MGARLEWGMVCDRGTVRKENQDAALLRLAKTEIHLPGDLPLGGIVAWPDTERDGKIPGRNSSHSQEIFIHHHEYQYRSRFGQNKRDSCR